MSLHDIIHRAGGRTVPGPWCGRTVPANGIWTLSVRGWVAGGIYAGNQLAFDLKPTEPRER